MTLAETLQEFLSVVDGIFGVYLDSTHGFMLNREEIKRSQDESVINKDLPIAELDNKPLTYNVGFSKEPGSYSLHECTQKEFKARNQRNGINFIIQANLCVTQIYSYWEDYYREKVAEHLNKNHKNEIKSDIFGDLRILRISILHKQSIAISEIVDCKVIKWFKHDDKIEIDELQFEIIIDLVKEEINRLKLLE